MFSLFGQNHLHFIIYKDGLFYVIRNRSKQLGAFLVLESARRPQAIILMNEFYIYRGDRVCLPKLIFRTGMIIGEVGTFLLSRLRLGVLG